jgi:hypothetical protein
MEANRGYHENFDTVIPPLLPDRYVFAELRFGKIVRVDGTQHCDYITDILAIPEERLSV